MLPFFEEQRSKTWRIPFIFIIVMLLMKLLAHRMGIPQAIVPVHFIMPGIVTLFLWFYRLKLTVNENGISYKLTPFAATKETNFTWDMIRSAKVEPYERAGSRPALHMRVSEAQGIIVRMGADEGLLVTLKDGKKIFFGTKKAEELRTALRELSPMSIRM